MFSKEEAKELRQQFWIFFDKRFKRKWLLYNTGVKEINLKFTVDNKQAMVSYDIETNDDLFREYYYDKFESLKTLMKNEVNEALVFEKEYLRTSGKVISRIYLNKTGVNIYRKSDWPVIFDFLYENMDKLEAFWLEYRDFISA
ncbi:MAG: hypothetical protein CL868_08485 [Cytophagaceae bacterium]|nr:hypothetical protein [Cytophagaceae bacterium]|tara:strand:- start:1067 stop:1495 length:429 start_codon:yes stop_codon:yes gene_type:complete